jgi:hypothetical protein
VSRSKQNENQIRICVLTGVQWLLNQPVQSWRRYIILTFCKCNVKFCGRWSNFCHIWVIILDSVKGICWFLMWVDVPHLDIASRHARLWWAPFAFEPKHGSRFRALQIISCFKLWEELTLLTSLKMHKLKFSNCVILWYMCT